MVSAKGRLMVSGIGAELVSVGGLEASIGGLKVSVGRLVMLVYQWWSLFERCGLNTTFLKYR